MGPPSWLLFVYKIPAEPSRHRVAVWRRLKEAGAVYLQNSICILPDTPSARELFRILSQEIAHAGGDSLLFFTRPWDDGEQTKVVARFNEERNEDYQEFLEECGKFLQEIEREMTRRNFTYGELEENEAGLQRLSVWLAKIQGRDFFHAELADKAQEALISCEGALEQFAAQVFAENQS